MSRHITIDIPEGQTEILLDLIETFNAQVRNLKQEDELREARWQEHERFMAEAMSNIRRTMDRVEQTL